MKMITLEKNTANTATEQLLNLWLHGKSQRTQAYYRLSAQRLVLLTLDF